jgi:hypothetical protein
MHRAVAMKNITKCYILGLLWDGEGRKHFTTVSLRHEKQLIALCCP